MARSGKHQAGDKGPSVVEKRDKIAGPDRDHDPEFCRDRARKEYVIRYKVSCRCKYLQNNESTARIDESRKKDSECFCF